MSIADNIRRIRARSGLTQDEFGKVAGVSNIAVSQWENGRAVPRMGAIQAISDYFGISKSEIMDDSTQQHPDWSMRMTSGGSAVLPLLRLGSVHAGECAEEVEDDGTVLVPEHVAIAHRRAFVLRVRGGCMNNVVPEGYDVVVDPDAEPRNGSVVVVELEPGEAVMRRWMRGGRTLVLSPDSHTEEHDDIVLRDADGPVRVLGVVVWAQRDMEG